MLVPAMTLEEIRKEVEKDLPIVQRKSGYVGHKLSRIFRDSLKKNNVVRFFDYCSKYKNKWIYKVELGKKEPLMSYMVYYYGNRGLAAVQPFGVNMMCYFTAHFFNRYNERRKLNLVMPHDIICTFMNETFQYNFKKLEEVSQGVYSFFGAIDSGVILGTYNEKPNIYRVNTFITSDMLMGSQVAMEEQLKLLFKPCESKGILAD